MQYNSAQEKLKLPEFGRNIQKMVEYCKTIQDQNERQLCAETIIEVMARIFPDAANKKENHPALWNQFVALADYDIDINPPVEIATQDDLKRPPQPIDYPEDDIVYRHYGHITQQLIAVVTRMSESAAKTAFIELIAKHMRNTFLTWGHSTIDNERIIKDLKSLSNGGLHFDEERLIAHLRGTNASSIANRSKVSKVKKKK